MKDGPSAPALVVIVIAAVVLAGGMFQAVRWVSLAHSEDPGTMGWTDENHAGPPRIATLGDPSNAGTAAWPGRIDTAVVAFDINGDGTKELVVQGTDRHIYVYDATTERTLAKLVTRYPTGWYIDSVLNAVAIDRLHPDEPPTIVVANHAASVTAWQFDPEASDDRTFRFEKTWERRASDCFADSGMDAPPVLADVDGDGSLEVLVQTEEQGLFALSADGEVLWKHCWSGGNAAPVVADLDGNGAPEAIFASDSGFVSVLDARTGAPQWTFDSREWGIRPASIPVAPTVADLDGEAPLEILFTARNAPSGDVEAAQEFHMAIFAIRANIETGKAELAWMRQPDWANPLSYTRLIVTDVDDDGAADIFGMDWNTIGHSPGNWERLGQAHAFRLDAEGNDVWVRPLDTWWSNKDILVSDSDGDGEFDVLVNGPLGATDGFWRLSAETGEREGFLATSPWKVMRGPTAIDLRGDGTMQIAFPVTPLEGSADRGAVVVHDLGVPFSSQGAG